MREISPPLPLFANTYFGSPLKTASLYWYHNANDSQSHVTKMKSPLLQFMARLENCVKLIWIGSFNVYISDIIDEQFLYITKRNRYRLSF